MKPLTTSLSPLVMLAFAAALTAQHAALVPPASPFRTSWRGFDTGTHATACWPWAARVGDLDGNGRPDVAVVNYWGVPRLGVLLNRGNGKLATPVQYSLPNSSFDLVIADFTLDGAPDIAVAISGSNYEGRTVSLFRNLGDGAFAPGVQVTVAAGTYINPVGLAAADFTGDGRVDLCVARNGYLGQGDQVVMLVNNGAGGFLPPASFPSGGAPYKLAAGDMDGDGRPDLAVAREGLWVSILRNTGAGFAPAASYAVPGTGSAGGYPAVELCDVDLDGDRDVLYASHGTMDGSTPAIALLRNRGDGTLLAAETLRLGLVEGGAIDLAAGDVDGDQWPDVLGASSARWSLLRGNGSGGFRAAEDFGATETPVAIELADMDADTHLDPVVLGRESLELAVYRNRGDGRFDTPAVMPAVPPISVPSVSRGMDAADIDGDGDLDVAMAVSPLLTNNGAVEILRGRGDGTFTAPVEYVTPVHAIYAKLADLNGDGSADLLWADDVSAGGQQYDVKTRMNDGTGGFGPITNWVMNTCGNGEVAAIDVDDDGDLDLTLCEYGGCAGGNPYSGRRVYIRRNDGTGNFAPVYVHIVSGFPERLHGADVDRDGRTDLLVTGNSWIDVCLGNGDGTFRPPLAAACDWAPKGFCVADLDGDGWLDLATTNYGDVGSGGESVSILFGNGDGTFQAPITKTSSYSNTYGNVRDIVAGDPDGDGDLDLMAGNWGSLDVSYFENRGGGNFAAQVRYGTGWNTLGLVFGDFSGDGRGDLLAQVSFGLGLNFRPGLVLLRGERHARFPTR